MNRLHGRRGGEIIDQTQARRRGRIKRVAALAALGLTPIVALGWAGCSSDDEAKASKASADPGGTFGAELTVSVKGRGRVTATVPGLDCPSDCFAKYIFESATADGAAGGVTLKAVPTPGSKFKGWVFDTEPVGSSGRGPEACNPLTRPGAQPSVNPSDLEITLPFGEVTGTPPAGREGTCANYTKVPVVYKITASFDTDPPPVVDSGADGGDGGNDTIVYEAPTAGATGREMGITQGNLYWVFTSGAYSGIAYGSSPASSAVPQTPVIVLNPASSQVVSLFEVDTYGVVYQTGSGVYYLTPGSTNPTSMGMGSVGSCSAVAADSQNNVYCRTSSTLVRWSYLDYSTPQTLLTGVASGSDLVVEGTGVSATAYFSTSSAIQSVSLSGADGGAASPTTVVSSRISPSGLESNTSYLWWVESGSLWRSSSKSASSVATNTGASGTSAEKIAPDTSSIYFWAATTTSIYKAYYTGASTQIFRSGLTGVGGVAADSTYVYYTQSDGRVRRAPKN